MSRLLLLAVVAAMLAACSEGGYYGYGYAVNERPTLAQLAYTASNADNWFHTGARAALAGEAQ